MLGMRILAALALGAAVLAVSYAISALLDVSNPLTILVVAFIVGVTWGGFMIQRERRQPRRVRRDRSNW